MSLKNVKTWRDKISLFFYYYFKTNWSWQYYSIFSNGNKIKNQVIAFRLILGVTSHTYRKTYGKSRAKDYTSQQTRHIYLMFDQCCPSVYDASQTLFRDRVDVSCLLECLTFFIALNLAFMMQLTSSDVQAHVYLKKCSQQVFSDNHFKTKGNVGFGHLLFYPKWFFDNFIAKIIFSEWFHPMWFPVNMLKSSLIKIIGERNMWIILNWCTFY